MMISKIESLETIMSLVSCTFAHLTGNFVKFISVALFWKYFRLLILDNIKSSIYNGFQPYIFGCILNRESFSCPFPFSIVYLQLEDNSVLINGDYTHLFAASDVSGKNGCCSYDYSSFTTFYWRPFVI